jgi:hypothetical protein
VKIFSKKTSRVHTSVDQPAAECATRAAESTSGLANLKKVTKFVSRSKHVIDVLFSMMLLVVHEVNGKLPG